MESYALFAGMALCLFSLWALARHDWLRLTRPRRTALGEVTGYRSNNEDLCYTYAAIYTFADENGTHEVVDAAYHSVRQPALGTLQELTFPLGRPDLARPPRPWLWGGIYLVLLCLLGLLLAKALGYIPG